MNESAQERTSNQRPAHRRRIRSRRRDLDMTLSSKIEIVEGLRISFPGREKEFSFGVEIGVISHLMANGEPNFRRWISRESLDQVKALASALGYAATVEQEYED